MSQFCSNIYDGFFEMMSKSIHDNQEHKLPLRLGELVYIGSSACRKILKAC